MNEAITIAAPAATSRNALDRAASARVSRRAVLAGAGGAALASGLPRPALAQADPGVRVSSYASEGPVGHSTNTHWVETPEGVFVVDGQWTLPYAREALAAIRASAGDKPLLGMLVTHDHTDPLRRHGRHRGRGTGGGRDRLPRARHAAGPREPHERRTGLPSQPRRAVRRGLRPHRRAEPDRGDGRHDRSRRRDAARDRAQPQRGALHRARGGRRGGGRGRRDLRRHGLRPPAAHPARGVRGGWRTG